MEAIINQEAIYRVARMNRVVAPGDPDARQLYEAARAGDMGGVMSALQRSPTIDIDAAHSEKPDFTPPFETALHAAVRGNHADVVAGLIALGANVNADSDIRLGLALLSPLHVAVMDRDSQKLPISMELLCLLLDSGADVNRKYHFGFDNGPLCNLVLERVDMVDRTNGIQVPNQANLDAIDLFISHGHDVNMPGSLWHFFDVTSEWINYVVELGYDDPDVRIGMLSGLGHANGLCRGQKSEFQTQDELKEGADRILAGSDREEMVWRMPKVLFAAVEKGYRGLVEFWLDERWRDWGIDINASEEHSRQTAMHKAAASYRNTRDVADFLLGRGVDGDATDSTGCTPLLCCQNGGCSGAEFAKLLLKHGADVKARDKAGNNALHRCVNSQPVVPKQPAIVVTLLAAGADPDAKNDVGDTPLHVAIKLAPPPGWTDASAYSTV
ncbi:hypothetical protein GGTG_13176 [Gaeumannomyces tritici R3-111a-1]|uniref:Ankyrin repeat protein n=1 Tax=Gaeumannomyces tritici (strain R3-111a-1) TaxID=644352 RepID=J3PI46_GAET3|nr:hypothetical protein GGTG_13176 [Gaeumannomyces tritici R3-111a-1]EJT69558.1 hypothetical protein GGTG_13176 [Gaeumannomyces tritici R3-111a-1]